MAQSINPARFSKGNIRITYPTRTMDASRHLIPKTSFLGAQQNSVAVNSLRNSQSDAMTAGLEQVPDKVLARVVPMAIQWTRNQSLPS